MPTNRYKQLYVKRLAQSTRPFNARGKLLKRCPECQIGLDYCICHWQASCEPDLDVVLLMHPDEILKPTNTGRLVADIAPRTTYAFAYSRTEPDPDFMAMLADPNRYCLMVFPADEADKDLRQVYFQPPDIPTGKRLTLIILDGTWKQARRMMRLAKHLQAIPALNLDMSEQGGYRLRKAINPGQLATAEAVAAVWDAFGQTQSAALLYHYFALFNQHYAANRGCHSVEESESSRFLAAFKARV